jgi:hypothetical protein
MAVEIVSQVAAMEKLAKAERDRQGQGANPALNVALLGPIAWTVYESTSRTCTLEEAAAAANWAASERGSERPNLLSYLDVTQRALDIIQGWE